MWFVVANEAGSYGATQYLLRMGHRNLAVITGPLHLTNAVERLKGFRRALDEAGVPIEPEYIQEARFNRAERIPGGDCGYCACCPGLLRSSHAMT